MDTSKLFDATYYQTGCGSPYGGSAAWDSFFATVAERIVVEIGPATVLDAGCALGLLVEQLRARGVDAEGIDISEYAIARAPEAVRDHVRVGSVAAPFPRRYDLIVCIEVLEHMPKAEAEAAVANFCAHSDDVLFSSSPHDYKEATHFNVNPPDYWAALFARHGLFRDLDFDAAFVTPWAVRFRRTGDPAHRVVRAYERRLWELRRENDDLRAGALEAREAIALAEAARAEARLLAAAADEARGYAGRLEAELAAKNGHIAALEGLLRRIENGRVMRMLRALAASIHR